MRSLRERFRFDRLGGLLVKRRWFVLVLLAGAVTVLGSMALRIREDLSFRTLYLSGDPEIAFSDGFSRTFENSNDTVVIVVTGPELFRPEVLQSLKDLTERLAGLKDIASVYSLGNIRYIQGRGEELDVNGFLEKIPTDPKALADLKARALAYRLFQRRLLSADGAYTAIVAQTADFAGRVAERRAFLVRMEQIVAGLIPAGCRHYVTGTNVVEKDYARIIARDRAIFLLLAVAVTVAGLALILRSLTEVLLAGLALAASGAVSLGVVHLTGGVIDIINSTIPSMILVVGTSNAIHMLDGFRRVWPEEPDARRAAARMVGDVGFSCFMASLTTIFGIGSLVFAQIGTVKRFGFNMSVAVAATYLVTLLTVTTLLSFRGAPPAGGSSRAGRDLLGRLIPPLTRLVVGRWRLVVLAWALLAALSVLGALRLEVNSHAVSEVREDSPVKVAMRQSEKLAGFLGLEVSVRSRGEARVLEPAVLRAADGLTAWLRSRPEVLTAWSVADYVKEMNAAAEGGGESQYRLPDTLEAAEQFLLLYGFSPEGTSEIKSLVSADRKWLRLVCRVRDVGAGPYLELVRETEQKGRELFGGDDRRFEVRVTGESFLLHRAMARILQDVATSNITAFLFIFGTMFIAFRSWRLGLLSIIPNVLPIFCTLAFMGLTGIPLRVGTIVVFSIGLGIAVDDTVHYFLRFRRERAEYGSYDAAVARTFSSVGRPMMITTVLLVAGFLSFVPAEFLSIRQMGILNAFTLVVALLADLTLTPVMLRLAPAPRAAPGAPAPAADIRKEVSLP